MKRRQARRSFTVECGGFCAHARRADFTAIASRDLRTSCDGGRAARSRRRFEANSFSTPAIAALEKNSAREVDRGACAKSRRFFAVAPRHNLPRTRAPSGGL
jgi:hypothetical protein